MIVEGKMAVTQSGRVWVFAILALILVGLVALYRGAEEKPGLAPEATQTEAQSDVMLDSVKVLSWEWREDKSGSLYAVWGMIKNESSRELNRVVLQLRTVDEDSNTISRYSIKAMNLPPLSTKPFREDVPRTGREHKGFMTVLKIVR